MISSCPQTCASIPYRHILPHFKHMHHALQQLRQMTDDRWTYGHHGDRCFAAAGPKLWNSLPANPGQADISFQRIKRLLKIFLFGCWDRGALWLTVKAVPHKFSYLLYEINSTVRYVVISRLYAAQTQSGQKDKAHRLVSCAVKVKKWTLSILILNHFITSTHTPRYALHSSK